MNLITEVMSALETIAEKEAAARRERDLPPDHVLTLDEFPFAFAVDDLKRLDQWIAEQITAGGDIDVLWYGRAVTSLALRNYPAANAAMEQWQRIAPHQLETTLRFGETPVPAHVSLPPVHGATPRRGGIFVGCDSVFFKSFAAALLRSIAANAPGMPVHVHLMGSDLSCLDRVRALPLELTISHEDCDAFIQQHGLVPNHYFGAVRLIRFADLAMTSDRPLWLIDADALAVRSPQPLFDMPDQLSLRVRAGRIEPWHQFSACLVQGSRRSADYFRRVGEILRAAFPHFWWGIDQQALLSAFIGLHPPLTLIGPDLAGMSTCDPAAMFWYYSGKKKWNVLEDQGPYGTLFRRYFNQSPTARA